MDSCDCLWMIQTWTIGSTDIFTQKYFLKLKLFVPKINMLLRNNINLQTYLNGFFGGGSETEGGVLETERDWKI